MNILFFAQKLIVRRYFIYDIRLYFSPPDFIFFIFLLVIKLKLVLEWKKEEVQVEENGRKGEDIIFSFLLCFLHYSLFLVENGMSDWVKC
jgi:hypothetical protein